MSEQQPPKHERRDHERYDLFAQVELRRAGQIETCTILNISASGLLARNDHGVEVSSGEIVRIHFDIPELTLAFSIDATVVRVVAATAKPAAFAAMWTSSDAAAIASLSELLWKLART